jgi:pilus assembly protein FimV
VVAFGAALDPENPLYAAGRNAPAEVGAAPDAAAPVFDTKSTVLLPGTLGVMAAGLAEVAIAGPEASAPEDAVGAVAAADEDRHVSTHVAGDLGTLDFELGETEQVVTPAPEPAADIPLPELESLDFDVESWPQESLPEAEVNPDFAPTETLVMGSAATAEDLSETFTGFEVPSDFTTSAIEAGTGLLDFDLGDATADTETIVNPGALHDDSSGDMGGDTVVNPMDIQESGRDTLSVVDGTAGMSVDFAAEDAEFDINLSESVFLGQPMPVPEFDLTSINLDLAASPTEETAVVNLAEDFDGGKAGADQGGEDMATKLALARAYEEMGDKDQARELLEEVIAEGGGDLAEQARQILGRLSG